MNPETRRQIEQYVKPLYAGLDGVQTFDRIERLRTFLTEIRAEAVLDEDLLELLLLFHGVVDRLGSLAPGGRLDLFLRGLGFPEDRVRRVRAALSHFQEDPRGPEENLLHDALLLESAGVVATAERLLAAGKKRVAISRIVTQLDPGPPVERYRTTGGARLGAERRHAAEQWIESLRRAALAEGIGKDRERLS